MHLLLCAATTFEIEPTIQYVKRRSFTGHQIDILITGVGLLPATFHLTRQVLLNRPQLIIQAGVGGSLDEALSLSETVLVGEDQVGDAGVFQNGAFSSLFDMGLAAHNSLPWTNGRLVNKGITAMQPGLKVVAGITVNEITTNTERIAYYKQSGAQIETMEGAALHYTCLMEDIPFVQLRSISNYAGERDKHQWRMKEAIANLNHELQNLFIKLLNE